MKILKLNEWIQTSTADKNLYNENKNQHQNKLTPDALNSVINFITSGTSPDVIDYKNERRIPVTHETISVIFPEMDQSFVDYLDDELKKRKLDWKYQHNEDAANDHSRNDWKTYDWTLDELNDACGI